MGKLSKAQKEKVITALFDVVGTLVEFWSEQCPELEDVPVEDGCEYIARLMRRMPGDVWDRRLGEP